MFNTVIPELFRIVIFILKKKKKKRKVTKREGKFKDHIFPTQERFPTELKWQKINHQVRAGGNDKGNLPDSVWQRANIPSGRKYTWDL